MFIWKISNTQEQEQLSREKREEPLNTEHCISSLVGARAWLPGMSLILHPQSHSTQEFGMAIMHTPSVPL